MEPELRPNGVRSLGPSPADRGPAPAQIAMTASRGFVDWMAAQGVSLAFTTYQTGKLFLLGRQDGGQLSGYERTFERAMGLASPADAAGQTLYMASLFQVWRFEHALAPGESLEGYDRYYVPQVGTTTGDLDVHDLAVDADGRVLFISARFSCLAATSDRYHFEPLWTPRFITRLAGEDRCHLNGLAMVDGRPRYVTACAQTDVVDGWRDHRSDGGVVLDIDSGEVVVEGLSMPHSPRWYRDRLWLLDSGRGDFGYVDRVSGRFEPVAFCPGFARGLGFVDRFAVLGLSLPRHDATFGGLALEGRLKSAGVQPRCGLLVVDLDTGEVAQWLRLSEPVRELYDVLPLPGVRRPRLVGFQTDEVRTRVWADPAGLERLSSLRGRERTSPR